jgi:hypothetical protein
MYARPPHTEAASDGRAGSSAASRRMAPSSSRPTSARTMSVTSSTSRRTVHSKRAWFVRSTPAFGPKLRGPAAAQVLPWPHGHRVQRHSPRGGRHRLQGRRQPVHREACEPPRGARCGTSLVCSIGLSGVSVAQSSTPSAEMVGDGRACPQCLLKGVHRFPHPRQGERTAKEGGQGARRWVALGVLTALLSLRPLQRRSSSSACRPALAPRTPSPSRPPTSQRRSHPLLTVRGAPLLFDGSGSIVRTETTI